MKSPSCSTTHAIDTITTSAPCTPSFCGEPVMLAASGTKLMEMQAHSDVLWRRATCVDSGASTACGGTLSSSISPQQL